MLKDMREEAKFQPDEILYNGLLDGCAREHRLQEALDLFAQMRAEGVKPSNYAARAMRTQMPRGVSHGHADAAWRESWSP